MLGAMLKLYYAPRTRALRPRWVLEELGVPYEMVRIDLPARENRKPAYLAVHPLGSVPALDDDGMVVIESSAICAYLAERFPEKGLTPPLGSRERGKVLQWIVYGVATMEPCLVAMQKDPSNELEAARWTEILGAVERALGSGPHLGGEPFTVADVVIGSVLWWARSVGKLPKDRPLADYAARLRKRPAAMRALAD